MVTNVTSLTGNGLKDWLIQRATAVYLLLYVGLVLAFFATHCHLTVAEWHRLVSCRYFQVATVIALIAILMHAWIGIWTVTTDYLKCTVLRVSVQGLVALYILAQFIWSLMIVWGR